MAKNINKMILGAKCVTVSLGMASLLSEQETVKTWMSDKSLRSELSGISDTLLVSLEVITKLLKSEVEIDFDIFERLIDDVAESVANYNGSKKTLTDLSIKSMKLYTTILVLTSIVEKELAKLEKEND